jgi:hypothetical protein
MAPALASSTPRSAPKSLGPQIPPLRDAVRPLVAIKNLVEAEDEPSALARGAIIASLISSVIWVSVIVAVVWRIWPPHG